MDKRGPQYNQENLKEYHYFVCAYKKEARALFNSKEEYTTSLRTCLQLEKEEKMKKKEGERVIKGLCEKVLKEITPSEKEKEDTIQFSRNLAGKLTKRLRDSGISAEVQVQGSIAKDTWVVGEKDVDLFILLPRTYTKEIFPKVLDVVKTLAGEKYLEAYAEHPYIQAEIQGYKVDFVPSFKIEKAEEAISSVDRTPLHTSYIKSRLNEKVKNEIRLLKQFMRGIDTYGAEIRVGGFSGYLCELIALRYGSFVEVLKSVADWKRGEVIDYEGYYRGREDEIRKAFEDHLVVVDPVDKGRNVAAAVREERLSEFIAAARAFLRNPDLKFFYPHEVEALDIDELVHAMAVRGSALVFVKFGRVRAVPDVLWGQLYKSQRSLRKMLLRFDFHVLRDAIWSNEEDINLFIFELEKRSLPPIKKHLGPPVEKREECERFLRKHLGAEGTLSGPRVEENRWVVEIQRRYMDMVELLADKLRDGGRRVGVADLLSQAIAGSFDVLVNQEILGLYSSEADFARFLTRYLKGKPTWLD